MEPEPRQGLKRTHSLSNNQIQEIEHWQRKSSIEETTSLEEKGIINRLYGDLTLVYESILEHVEDDKNLLSRSSYRRLESGYTSLRAWAVDHGVEEGRLDSALDRAQKLRKYTIKTMADICETLTKGSGRPIPLAFICTGQLGDANSCHLRTPPAPQPRDEVFASDSLVTGSRSRRDTERCLQPGQNKTRIWRSHER